ncbi:MAG: hypothetical protein IV086_00390 [Hyphomonadaceae bacterium]|nr:MAG: hypothetical protein FD160_1395 [Caulobacteraceae bacterium]MBT9444134.1 hypothetical protein [Hyphomonadaceae bacterium]TPW07745.1 MAG: hypothetical protein FD124_916 [Alphaproteobacteria bacterium]
MKHIIHKKPDIARVNAIAQSLRLWVLEIAAWVARLVGVKFRPDIAEEIYAAKLCVFLHAIDRCDQRGRAFARRHWRGAPPGFRYAFKRGKLRAFTRVVKLRDLPELRELLDDMEPAIARVVAQLKKKSIHTCLVPVAPRADDCIAACAHLAPECADTS